MRYLLVPALTALLALSSTAFAAVSPDILQSQGRSDAAHAADAGRRPIELLNFYDVKPGERVLDLMAGGGYYSELIGKAVGPKGSVIAFDLPIGEDGSATKERESWKKLQERNPNVHFVGGDIAHPAFAPASFDFALLHLIYHDLYWESAQYHYPHCDPDEVLKRLYAAMKPGAIVGVVDHVAEPNADTRAAVEKLHRIDPTVVKADFKRAGFELVGESPLLMTGQDDHSKLVFDAAVRGKTDRFVFKFRKPK
ncbi:Predicted methyltransferase [Sphingomonas sp. YR710]|uniref:class I SAM-dependent methyltransferase n=1 Tax=Sphingomonas sp. YR710 TaxID=1882773 RepID=UPI00088B9D24|nr:methyltransferase domain-containing protein [Sphingomonas sp. YR710]SDD29704.1 Predicted methyltransferase [Sphingomonas sp. YR710]